MEQFSANSRPFCGSAPLPSVARATVTPWGLIGVRENARSVAAEWKGIEVSMDTQTFTTQLTLQEIEDRLSGLEKFGLEEKSED